MEIDNHDKDSKGNDCSDDGINDIGDDDYNLSVAITKTTVYNISTNFPTQCSDLYYHSLNGLGKGHSLTGDGFVKGRMVAVMDLQREKLQDAIAIENSGCLRNGVELSQAHDSNIVLFLIGVRCNLYR